MTRAIVVAVTALCLLATPAQGFQSCVHNGTTVTATFGDETTGTLRQVGDAIHTEDGACGGATTANTNTINVVGGAPEEELTIDLAGGTFLGGATPEGDGTGEVEITGAYEGLHIEGTPGVDRVTAGFQSGSPTKSYVNLNAGEAVGDADVTMLGQFLGVRVDGAGGADVLSAGGGAGTGNGTPGGDLRGEAGGDDLTLNNGSVTPGPGDDVVRVVNNGLGSILYKHAPSPVTVEMHDGTGGDWGGAPSDGEGGSDTFIGRPLAVAGSATAANVLHGSAGSQLFEGGAAADELEGGAGQDFLHGGGAGDTLRGGLGNDTVRGEDGGDDLFGEGDDDVLEGGTGNDDEHGGPGDDRFRHSGYVMPVPEAQGPNGADDLRGGDGIDTVEYAEPSAAASGGVFSRARSAPVTVDLDDVADDGAAGEGDNVRSDVENVVGGAGSDTLTGDGDPNDLRGFAGADTLAGAGGADLLFGSGARGFNAAAIAAVENSFVDGADQFDGGAGADAVDANEGDDVIEVRDGVADTVTCGTGHDTGRRDAADTVASDCEGLALPVAMPADPPVTPPADPPATPPAQTPPAQTPPIQTPPNVQPPVSGPAPPVAQLLALPSSRRCASRRKFTVRVRREIRGQVKRVLIFINGRRVKTVTGTRIGLPIDLRGLPKGRIRVRLQVELADGRTAIDTRTYRTCATKKRRGRLGRRRG